MSPTGADNPEASYTNNLYLDSSQKAQLPNLQGPILKKTGIRIRRKTDSFLWAHQLARRNYNSITTLEEEENRRVVEQLYVALGSGDSETVGRILAADLEWWFHGPPSCDHMMRLLTGASGHKHFSFNPKSITAAGNKVFVEGHENESAYWVHVWTLKDNIVTQLREFFNTSLVAREFTPHSSSLPRREMVACNLLVWESEIPISQGNSMPGLVLAI
ncbi:hypothetical protein SUGI_0782420 [Cryptomeria japonica]|nr:hypothetical protein SUGI_0782420 [Cryptomeria japonica]